MNIQEKAMELYPVKLRLIDDPYLQSLEIDHNRIQREQWIKGAEWLLSSLSGTDKQAEEVLPDPFSGDLNTERIKEYKKLLQEYNITNVSMGNIFTKALTWYMPYALKAMQQWGQIQYAKGSTLDRHQADVIYELQKEKIALEKQYDDHENQIQSLQQQLSEREQLIKNQRWVPVSPETMPKEEDGDNDMKRVFALNKFGSADAVYYEFVSDDNSGHYIAWMPIPKYVPTK